MAEVGPRTRAQAEWIVHQGWLAPAVVERALIELQRSSRDDLGDLLVERGLLSDARRRVLERRTRSGELGPGDPDREETRVDMPGFESRPGRRRSARRRTLAVTVEADPEIPASLRRSSELVPLVSPSASGRVPPVRPTDSHSPARRSIRELLATADPGPELVGSRVGPYTVTALISHGNIGAVLKARREGDPGVVALKVLTSSEGHADGRFRREIRLMISLGHRNIVRIMDFGVTDDELLWFAMELIDGETLEEFVQRTIRETGAPPTPRQTAELLAPLASALQYCHSRGVVHRDVKPTNIVIERDSERPVLIDFGLGKRAAVSHITTTTDGMLSVEDEIRGTPAFMAPEQADPAGEFGSVGEPSDVWSLMATLFYCLTGKSPFDGPTTANIVLRLMTDDAPDPRELRPDLPDWTSALCQACFERHGDARLTMVSVSAILESAATGAQPQALPDPRYHSYGGRTATATRTRLRRLISIGLIAAAIALLVALQAAQLDRTERRQATLQRMDRRLALTLGRMRESIATARDALHEVPPSRKIARELREQRQALEDLRRLDGDRAELAGELGVEESPELRRQALDALQRELISLDALYHCRTAAPEALPELADAVARESAGGSETLAGLWSRAIIARRCGRIELARGHYEALIERAPERLIFYEELASLFDDDGRASQAVRVLKRAAHRCEPAADRARALLHLTRREPASGPSRLRDAYELGLEREEDVRLAACLAWRHGLMELLDKVLPEHIPHDAAPELQLAAARRSVRRLAPRTALMHLGRIQPSGLPSRSRVWFHALQGRARLDLGMDSCRESFSAALEASDAPSLVALRTARLLTLTSALAGAVGLANETLGRYVESATPTGHQADLVRMNLRIDSIRAGCHLLPARFNRPDSPREFRTMLLRRLQSHRVKLREAARRPCDDSPHILEAALSAIVDRRFKAAQRALARCSESRHLHELVKLHIENLKLAAAGTDRGPALDDLRRRFAELRRRPRRPEVRRMLRRLVLTHALRRRGRLSPEDDAQHSRTLAVTSALAPFDPQLAVMSAYESERARDTSRTIEWLSNALCLDPLDPAITLAMTRFIRDPSAVILVRRRLDEIPESRAEESKPLRADLHARLAQVLQISRPDDALEEAAEALKLNPCHREALTFIQREGGGSAADEARRVLRDLDTACSQLGKAAQALRAGEADEARRRAMDARARLDPVTRLEAECLIKAAALIGADDTSEAEPPHAPWLELAQLAIGRLSRLEILIYTTLERSRRAPRSVNAALDSILRSPEVSSTEAGQALFIALAAALARCGSPSWLPAARESLRSLSERYSECPEHVLLRSLLDLHGPERPDAIERLTLLERIPLRDREPGCPGLLAELRRPLETLADAPGRDGSTADTDDDEQRQDRPRRDQ